MCWSFEVSIAAGTIVLATLPILIWRNASRDRGHALFLAVFGSMQFVDAMLWWLAARENLRDCSAMNRRTTRIAGIVIMCEPIAAFVGACYTYKRKPTRIEVMCYAVLVLLSLFPSILVNVKQNGECGGPGYGFTCSSITEGGHLMYSPGTAPFVNGTWIKEKVHFRCWRQYILFGTHITEVPFPLRVLYLLAMCYPFLEATPFLSGFLNILILTCTWLVGYMSDAHSSMWCLANVVQVITMLADPYMFTHLRSSNENNTPKRGKRELITEDRFSPTKVPKDLDVVIVGSGIGGLATAALLAKSGKRVLVLEQHYRAGGCTHVFTELGTMFDSGVHYLGSPKMLTSLLGHIASAPVHLSPMGTKQDGFTYDEFDLGDGVYVKYRKGIQELEQELVKHFPQEKEGIKRYLKHLRSASLCARVLFGLKCLPRWVFKRFVPKAVFEFVRRSTCETASEVVAKFVKDSKLRALLSGGQLIDWNLAPNKVSWWVVASMMNYYQYGGFYPEGGSELIATHVITTIENNGGRVLCRAPVESILIDPDTTTAFGIRLKNGTEIRAPIIISNAGASVTYEKLLDRQVLKKVGLQTKVPGVGPSNSHMTAFVTLDGSASEFGLRAANIHSMPDLGKFGNDLSAMQEAFYASPLDQPGCLITVTCPSVKDPLFQQRFPNKSNVLMLAEAKFNWFAPFESDPYGNRSSEYKDFKKSFENIFLNRLYELYPATKGHVASIELGTPLTNKHFLGAPNGESYGLEWVPNRFDSELGFAYLHPESVVRNLYLTGEASLFGGVVGACLSGFVTTLHVLGLSRFVWVMSKSTNVNKVRL